MGRYSSSNSEDERRRSKKKKKRRSRSRSASSVDSYSSSKRSSKKSKKSKKKHRKRSRSRSADYKKRRSRSRSRGRRSTSRSRGRRSRSRGRRSRSRSSSYSKSYKSRRSRSGSRSAKSSVSRRRSRSRSWSKSKVRRRSRSRSRSKNVKSRSSSVSRDSKHIIVKEEKEDPCASIPGFQDMSLVEQNKVRMNMALKAAETDARLREQGILLPSKKESVDTLYGDDSKRQKSIADIEGESFTQQSFSSNRGQGRVKEETADDIHEAAMFGDTPTLPTITSKKGIVYSNTDSLLAPVFYEDPAEKWERWAQYVRDYRQSKLEGEAMT